MLHYRYAHSEAGLQRRFYELRFDSDERRISGTAMRYGDEAKLPWGEKERFEPGAFGDVSAADVILNVQHSRDQPIARTKGAVDGGLLTLSDTGGELRIEAILPDTTTANDALANVRAGILRGFSVEFMPKETRKESDTIVVEKAVLRAIGLVDRPAYPKSRVLPRSEIEMDAAEVKALIERTVTEALSKRSEGDPVDPAAIATAVSAGIAPALEGMVTAESVRAEIEAALTKRDEAEAARAKAEEERAAMKKKADDEEMMMMKKAGKRADLLVLVNPLLPEGTENRDEMSDHALLVAAVGDEVSDAENRSEDYLLAKVEAIAERRAAAARGAPPAPSNPNPMQVRHGGPSIVSMVERRHRAAK